MSGFAHTCETHTNNACAACLAAKVRQTSERGAIGPDLGPMSHAERAEHLFGKPAAAESGCAQTQSSISDMGGEER